MKIGRRNIAIAGIALAVGTVACMIPLLLFGYGQFPNVTIPTGPDWLYRYQLKFRQKLQGDRLIGGGHVFLFDGRDLWICFRLKPNQSAEAQLPTENICDPVEQAMVRDWFLKYAVKQRKLLGIVPLPDDFQADREILNRDRILCDMDVPLPQRLGEYPDTCGFWSLYDPQTRYYYLRYGCYN